MKGYIVSKDRRKMLNYSFFGDEKWHTFKIKELKKKFNNTFSESETLLIFATRKDALNYVKARSIIDLHYTEGFCPEYGFMPQYKDHLIFEVEFSEDFNLRTYPVEQGIYSCPDLYLDWKFNSLLQKIDRGKYLYPPCHKVPKDQFMLQPNTDNTKVPKRAGWQYLAPKTIICLVSAIDSRDNEYNLSDLTQNESSCVCSLM
ncbi:hypothetical protein [Legionella impletisoli]|uniref:Uncharacterized protein n=1 Tax=Legionella impletisoli TaxID=343510 RepID=A0A917JXV8_9GAMM|nr:hypothetical protein [Legionella impletisoli]GGI91544.1 hypothetical protein GCM10007966_20220 [Legionella impletisoli]